MPVFRKQQKHVDPTGRHFTPTLSTAMQTAAAYQDAIESAAAAHQALSAMQVGGFGPATIPGSQSFLHVDPQGNPVIGASGAPNVGVRLPDFAGVSPSPTDGGSGYLGGSASTGMLLRVAAALGIHGPHPGDPMGFYAQREGPDVPDEGRQHGEELPRPPPDAGPSPPPAPPPTRRLSADPDAAGPAGWTTAPPKRPMKPITSTGDPSPTGEPTNTVTPRVSPSLGPSLGDAPTRQVTGLSSLRLTRNPLGGRGDPPRF